MHVDVKHADEMKTICLACHRAQRLWVMEGMLGLQDHLPMLPLRRDIQVVSAERARYDRKRVCTSTSTNTQCLYHLMYCCCLESCRHLE